MHRATILILSVLLIPHTAMHAQERAIETEAAQVVTGEPQASGPVLQAAPTQAGSGLPQQNAAARTMRAYWHVFIAFAVVWLLLFGYALTVGRRFGELEEEVRRLRSPS